MTKLKSNFLVRASGVMAIVALAVAPVAVSAVSDTKSTTVTATVASTISMTTSGTVAIAVTPTASGAASSASDTVTVNTNSTGSMTLTLANNDATTNLAFGGNTIPAHAGTQTTPTTLANNTWGYRVDSVGGFGVGPTAAETNVANLAQTWAGVPASGSANTIKTQTGPLTNNVTTVWYGVKADTSKTAGAYTDTVTYTATAP